MSNLWLTADTHFFHTNIIRYCGRPFRTVEGMNEAMIQRWNHCVGDDDMIVHLGDFALGPAEQIKNVLARLKGRKGLILGNHDRHSVSKFENLGFKAVAKEKDFQLPDGTRLILRHHPPTNEEQNARPHVIWLCGHVHEKWKVQGQAVNVGVDQWDFRPVSVVQVLDALRNHQRLN